jgi:hypothetical protein
MFAIIGFISLYIAIFLNEEVSNLYIWPIVIVIFAALFFASFNIQTSTTVVASQNVTLLNSTSSITTYEYAKDTTYFDETAFAYMFLGLALLGVILFTWDVFKQWQV